MGTATIWRAMLRTSCFIHTSLRLLKPGKVGQSQTSSLSASSSLDPRNENKNVKHKRRKIGKQKSHKTMFSVQHHLFVIVFLVAIFLPGHLCRCIHIYIHIYTHVYVHIYILCYSPSPRKRRVEFRRGLMAAATASAVCQSRCSPFL